MSKRSSDEVVGIAIAVVVGALMVYAAIAIVVVEWATLLWTTVRLRPALLPASEVSHVAIHALLFHESDAPRSWDGVAPPLWIGVFLTLLLAAVVAFVLASVDALRDLERPRPRGAARERPAPEGQGARVCEAA